MANDAVFSPVDEGTSPDSGIEITIEEDSGNSEELLDEEEEEGDIEIETNCHADEDNQMLEVKSNDLVNVIQQVIGIEGVDLENDRDQVLDIRSKDLENDNKQALEFDQERNTDRMREIPSSSDQMLGVPGSYNESATEGTYNQPNYIQRKSFIPPAVGMEFESYDDAYNYYNCYAKELGFGIRVKSSWTKRNSKEKRGAVLCCNCEGFKTVKEASTRRKETRTGCLAMIRLRLMETNGWRLDEVKIEHNHLLDHQRVQTSRSHKKMEAGTKRKLESPIDVEVQTIKLYRTPTVDVVSYGSSTERGNCHHVEVELLKRLRLKKGDVLALCNYFTRAQLADPNFFYIMDLNDEGYVRNVFWIDSRSRAAYGYYGDVVVVDTTCQLNNYNIPLCSLSGLNNHGQSVLLGCGLLVDETIETYLWLMRAWLTCLSGRPPQTIITQQCQALRGAISEVFPRSHHCLCLPHVVQSICEKLGDVGESEIFKTFLNRAVYTSIKVEEFEMTWEQMRQHFGLKDHEWLQFLYDERERWVPAYLKDTLFNGMYTFLPGKYMNPFFHGHLHEEMAWDEFFDVYESLQQKQVQKEIIGDLESREFRPLLRTGYSYEAQVTELYSKEIFLKFQEEVFKIPSCFNTTQVHANGSIITYMVKERNAEGDDAREVKNFEVVYDKVGIEVRCICSCFSLKGYLCRHALSVLSYNNVHKIPNQYILRRWRKDVKRLYTTHLGSNHIDISNPVQWYDHLYRRAVQVVAEGMTSREHHMVAWQAFKDSLSKVRLAAEKHV